MKKLFTLLTFFVLILKANAQNTFPATGNVGIGTTSPRGQFDVAGTGDIYLSNNPVVGTGQSIYLPGHIYMAPYNGTDWTYLQARRPDNSGSTNLEVRTWNAGTLTNAMVVRSNGNIGIGTYLPNSYKLAVAGSIGAWGEVRVFTTNSSFPDYVFDPSYQLPSLEETEKYVKENHHLPEVPSAADIEKDGISLNGMNTILLKKVEELTLHIIDQNKRIEALEKKVKN